MNEKAEKLLSEIVGLSLPLADVHRGTIDDWAPERPPATIAYGAVGTKLVDIFDELDPNTRRSIFALVEDGMQSDDEATGTAVATGLIEALAGRASRTGRWERVRAELGSLSRSHAEAWLQG
ncbi:hypothetical protein [Bradyrhizobium sp. CCBAU 53421]|uniref:hypothetical protein n=1 Tax=Bradyrhizobium sp. CCBAU 53421 TaxID=1325120 RepID=UPI00188C14F9|nr:hypothetical protein [Bradyrhizobium sp. CCBAU 53421]QOZ30630.1 hypothetical protein XH92_01950 [Bradyrhizobium sp. CCBAU 53421]